MIRIKTSTPGLALKVTDMLVSMGLDVKKEKGNIIDASNSGLGESELKIELGRMLDDADMDFDMDFVLVNGSTVWSVRNIMGSVKSFGRRTPTAHFYKFMSVNFDVSDMVGWDTDRLSEVLGAGSGLSDVQSVIDTLTNEKLIACTA